MAAVASSSGSHRRAIDEEVVDNAGATMENRRGGRIFAKNEVVEARVHTESSERHAEEREVAGAESVSDDVDRVVQLRAGRVSPNLT